MPRRPKPPEKVVITMQVPHGETEVDVDVYFHPPNGRKRSWYVYWAGLENPKSTGARSLDDAKAATRKMLCANGQREMLQDVVLTDREFELIQRRHFSKKLDDAARARAEKSLKNCLEAIEAFQAISGITPISKATADECEHFQHAALKLPKNWRSKHPRSKKQVASLSPNTVIKWSVALQAAFERACRDSGKKGVRGVVAPEKLLSENPWKQFTWIEGTERPLRQFDPTELLSILDYFEERWPIVTVAALVTKVFLWSWGRKSEVVGLRWDMLRQIGSEVHFEIVGKWGVVKWFRIPESLFEELLKIKTANSFVFAAYSDQIREQYRQQNRSRFAARVSRNFSPQHLGDWMYERIKQWSEGNSRETAYLHVFRKTSLQYARRGEDTNQRVAMDARLGARVMMTSYVRETDEELRQKSNRTFERIAGGFPASVIDRYGFKTGSENTPLVDQLKQAVEAGNWDAVSSLSARLKSGVAETEKRPPPENTYVDGQVHSCEIL